MGSGHQDTAVSEAEVERNYAAQKIAEIAGDLHEERARTLVRSRVHIIASPPRDHRKIGRLG